ncbi:MAG: alpha/beta hydrolase [Leptospiraceae bacterium]|nr:alpha/beta hydrolase [Leptospiraceae bacterium]
MIIPARIRHNSPLLVVILSSLFWGCISQYPPEVGRLLQERIQNDYSETQVIDLLYFTNREMMGRTGVCSNQNVTVKPGPRLVSGLCRVQVPRNHEIGALDQAESAGADPRNRFSILSGELLDDGMQRVNSKEVVVFIHGFNVKFEEAVLRASQIQYDLKFPFPVILFSWPAGASDEGFLESLSMTTTYRENQSNAAATVNEFARWIGSLGKKVQTVHLIVHSMGHQVAIPGLKRALENQTDLKFGEIVFFAPDFPATEYDKYAPTISGASYRTTLYCSPGDNALLVSRKVNGNYRLGMCKKVPNTDVINVNEVDDPVLGIAGLGHGYYSSRAIITDLFQLFLGVEAKKRLFIRQSDPGHGEDYVLRK